MITGKAGDDRGEEQDGNVRGSAGRLGIVKQKLLAMYE